MSQQPIAQPKPQDAEAIEILKRLPRILAAEGFTDTYTLYGPLNSRAELWKRDLHLLPDNLRALVRLFLLGDFVQFEELEGIFTAAELEGLEQLSIILRTPRGFHTGNLALVFAYGYFLLAERPGVNPLVYFGDDSAALAAHLAPPANSECLDLCAGPGIQSLLCSGRARSVIAVELNPLAASHAELNVVMNNVEQIVKVRMGDLYEAVPGLKFDFVCANPPLLPFPPDLPYPFVGHGGADGLEITRRILRGLPGVLKPDGESQIIGTCLGNESGPLCESELRDYSLQHNLRVNMTVPTGISLTASSSTFESLAWSCAAASGLKMEDIRERFRAHLEQLGATRLDLFFLHISNARGKADFTITRHYRERRGFWFLSA